MNPPDNSSGPGLPPDHTPGRTHRRVPFSVEVSLESEHNFYTGFTQNISSGGLFIATHTIQPIGSVIEFTFTLDPYPEKLTVRGEVRWIREGSDLTSDMPAGMGVQFTDLHPTLADRINKFIDRQRETIFFDE